MSLVTTLHSVSRPAMAWTVLALPTVVPERPILPKLEMSHGIPPLE